MLLAAAVRARLEAGVADLAGRVLGAADMQRLIAQNRLPQVTPAAVVMPLGAQGGPVVAVMGAFRQIVVRRVGVAIVLRAPGGAEARRTDDIEALAEAVLAALAGWTPEETTPGVMRLEGSEVMAREGGTLVAEMVFALDDAEEVQ